MITADSFRKLPEADQIKLLNQLTESEAESLYYDWSFWARPDQRLPEGLGKDGKFIWMVLTGRGWGKTRTATETTIDAVNRGYKYLSLVGATAEEVRDVMIEGESGLLAHSPPWNKPEYIPSLKTIIWKNGARANIYYGTEPEKSRGAQSDFVWMDELCKYKYPEDTYDNLMFGCRLGKNPIVMITTTPKPTKLIKQISKDDRCIITRGSTKDNFRNLAPVFISSIVRKYEGTRLGRQELNGEILDDNPNALWNRAKDIDAHRIKPEDMPVLKRIVVSVDPSGSSSETSDECGIISCGVGAAPKLPGVMNSDLTHFYIVDDASLRGKPLQWGQEVVDRYNSLRADRIVAEINYGGEMVESNIKTIDKNVPYSSVWASRSKYIRAEPISTLYEQGRVHHVGFYPELEDELSEWTPGAKSPNRLDAMVWGVTFLVENDGGDFAAEYVNW